jgi:hypothetical protein
MITNKCLCLLVAFSLATLSFASCKITTTPAQSPDTPPQPQPSPTSTPSAPGFIPAVNISAMGIPDYDVSEAQLEQHPGGVPFKIILYIDPLQPEDLDPAVIYAYDVSKQWDSERVLALLPPASPVTTEFGFFSDGLIYSSADTFTGGTTRSELPSGSDVTFTFTTWTQLPDAGEDGAEIGVGDRIWYKSFNLDSDNTRFVSDLDTDIDAGATEAQTPTGKSTTVEDYANESKYNFQSDRYAVQFWFAQNPESGPDTGTDEGLALIPTTIDIPISPIVTINRVDPEPTVSGEFIAHSGVLLWDLKDDVPLDTSFDSDQILINNVFNTTGDLSTLPLYRYTATIL